LRFPAFEDAEPDAQVRDLPLQPEALCLHGQCPVLGELPGLALQNVHKLPDEERNERLVIADLLR
jgi:hypothetical protein